MYISYIGEIRMKYTGKNHTFVICAYKENPHLEETIQSLMNQTVKCKIILSTSTPNDYLKNLCQKYHIEMFINPVQRSAGDDWNYGYSMADTELVTIAHQDDFYEPDFLEQVLKAMNMRDDIIMTYTDYYEYKLGVKETTNLLLKIKRLMNAPLAMSVFWKSRFMRRRILSFGCPICCPAATFVKKNAGENIFNNTYKNSCDYMTWVTLADKKGSFIYIPKMLLAHRIYAESATSLNLSENIRQKEDFEILCHYWPKPVARAINSLYATSEKSNKI